MTFKVQFRQTDQKLSVGFQDNNKAFGAEFKDFQTVTVSGGVSFTTDETLYLKDGVLGVNTAHEPEPDNTLPITAAAVYSTVGNIEVLLKTI